MAGNEPLTARAFQLRPIDSAALPSRKHPLAVAVDRRGRCALRARRPCSPIVSRASGHMPGPQIEQFGRLAHYFIEVDSEQVRRV